MTTFQIATNQNCLGWQEWNDSGSSQDQGGYSQAQSGLWA